MTFGGGGQDSTEGFLSLVFWTVSIVFDFVLGLLPGAGIAPGGADTFLLSNKKVPKEIDPAAHDPPLRSGQPASVNRSGAPRNSLRAKALWSNSRGESVVEAVASLDATAAGSVA